MGLYMNLYHEDLSTLKEDIKKARAIGAPALAIEALELEARSIELVEKIAIEAEKPEHQSALKALSMNDDHDDHNDPEWLNADIGYFEQQGDTETAALIREYKQTMRDFHKADDICNAAMDSVGSELDSLDEELETIMMDLGAAASELDEKSVKVMQDAFEGLRPKKLYDAASHFEGGDFDSLSTKFNRIAEIMTEIMTITNQAVDKLQHKTPKP